MAKASLPKPPSPVADAPVRRGYSAADSARLDALQARAVQLGNLKRLTTLRYHAALRELVGIVDQVLQLQISAGANPSQYIVKPYAATGYRTPRWHVITTPRHPTPGRTISIHCTREAAMIACAGLRSEESSHAR